METVDLFRKMVRIRLTEESLLHLFSKGLLNGTVHTCIGQEACAVGVISALDIEKDIIYSNHRGHGHYLAYSGDIKSLIAEVMGDPSGVCSGVGGSQHLQLRNFYTNGILGAGLPVIAGMLFAEKMKKSGAIGVAFCGEGTFGEGALYEALNLVSLWSIPLLLVIEHNRYSQSTPFEKQHAGTLETRGLTFNIPTTVEDGMDLSAVQNAAKRIITRIRTESKPEVLFLNTYRFSPHSKGDDVRDIAEITKEKERDPLVNYPQSVGISEANQIIGEERSKINIIIESLISKGREL